MQSLAIINYPFGFIISSCNKMAAFRGACFNLGKETSILRLSFCVQRQNIIRVELHMNHFNNLQSCVRQALLKGNSARYSDQIL